jgi:hypothetical protein
MLGFIKPSPHLSQEPPNAQCPFARRRRYLRQGDVNRLLRGHYSPVFAPTGTFANPTWLSSPSARHLGRGVCAGCDQPLLPPGPSRRYLCESFPRCPSPCPGGLLSAFAWFFPSIHRPSPSFVWVGFPLPSANTTFHGSAFEAAAISLCSGLRVCSPPRSFLPLQVPLQGSRGFFTSEQNVRRYLRTHRTCYPPDYRQLAERELSSRKIRSLVGCSRMMPTFPPLPLKVGSRTDARLLRFDLSVAPRFLWECLTNRIVSWFSAPAASNRACPFRALGLPVCFLSRLM